MFMDAFTHNLEKPETLLPVFALINRIRLCASRRVLTEAERLLERITDQYFEKNSDGGATARASHTEHADPLSAFGEACRAELKSLRAGM